MKKEIFEKFFQKPEGFLWSEEMQCYYEHKDFRFQYKEDAIYEFNQKYLGWLAALQCSQAVVDRDTEHMYTREEFEYYKSQEYNQVLTVSYWYCGQLESIDHETYEDYVNTFVSYIHMHKENK